VKLALLAAGLAVVLDASPSAADTYPRQPGVNALHYVFRLTLADGSREIASPIGESERSPPSVSAC
jgi:hypothetical protein